MKKEYDLICSLGGNCAAAHNLLIRKLRQAAYPFDWIYFKSDEAVYKIADGFKNKFSYFMQKNNLKLLPQNESHPMNKQYEDTYGKIVWANHFSKELDDNEYKDVKKIFEKRINRLIKNIQESKRILFVFSLEYEADVQVYRFFMNFLINMFPDKDFSVIVVSFNSLCDEILTDGGLIIYKYKRKINYYDFVKTNIEWDFLDNITIKSNNKSKFLQVIKISKGYGLYFLQNIKTVLRIKLYFLSLQFDFCIGKVMD